MKMILLSVLFFSCLHIVRSGEPIGFRCAAIPPGDGWDCYQEVGSTRDSCDGTWFKANETVISNGINYTVYIGTAGRAFSDSPINCGSSIGVSYELNGYLSYSFQKNFPNGWECGVPIDGNRDQHLRLEVFGYKVGTNPKTVEGMTMRMLQVDANNAVASPDGNTYSAIAHGSSPDGPMSYRKCDGSSWE